jgi:hypothetical protein
MNLFFYFCVSTYKIKEIACHYCDNGNWPGNVNFVLLPELSTKELQQLAIQFKIQVLKVIDLLWLFLELHMLKLMLLSIMLLCIFDVSETATQGWARWG